MKKFLLSIALVALALSFTSCGDDEPYVPQITNETVIGKDLINSTVTLATNSVTYIETADYTFDIEYRDMREATVKVVAKNVKFDSHMPYPVTYAMEPIKTYQLNDQYVRFISSKVKFLNPGTDTENTNYTLTKVVGYIDKRNKVFTLTYTVNDKWKVIVTSSTIRSRIAPGNDYTAPTELYYIYKINIATKKAEVFLHNIQFTIDGTTSPVLKKTSCLTTSRAPTLTRQRQCLEWLSPTTVAKSIFSRVCTPSSSTAWEVSGMASRGSTCGSGKAQAIGESKTHP